MDTKEVSGPETDAQVLPPPPPPPTERAAGRRWARGLAIVMAAVLLAGGPALYLVTRDDASAAAREVVITQSNAAPPESTVAAMIARVLPSIVNVRTTTLSAGAPGAPSRSEAQGSGVIIDPDGIILTNNHVVSGATSVRVFFNDDRGELEGTVVGTDPQHDLAVIKVHATDLDAVTVGRSGNLELGDTVVALGFPLGLGGPTVTKGIVSGLDRAIDVSGGPVSENHLEGLLQTDAAINPGNSGGALVDAGGRLVGINTAAASAAAAENIGFAIAIDEAIPVVEQILEHPAEERAWLGVSVTSLDSDALAARAGLPAGTRGALVVATVASGPAAKAGLRRGDVIVSLGGSPVESSPDLTRALADAAPGETVDLELVSPAGSRTVELELGSRPATLPSG